MTHAQIATFLAPAELEDGLESVHLLRHPHGRPTGEAYVELRDQKSMDFAVQQKHKQMMGRRYIEVSSIVVLPLPACAAAVFWGLDCACTSFSSSTLSARAVEAC